ncbi:MAG: 5-(carboxyamino)imidazole ribonucleotide mutase, partial [Methanobrevibacter sp.]|nr:5-(carboxyamino)imidazole ribonucleotide mutase [Methanobrevibacter sp.]
MNSMPRDFIVGVEMNPKVMIILGSASDSKIAQKAIDILENLQIPYSLNVASAHRTHEKVKNLVIEGTERGIEVFIGIAGLAAHLPGSIAAYTHKPVIGVPVDVKVGGLDALYATAQMPFPAPVATVGIDRGDNGAILAAQIIATKDKETKEKIDSLRNSYETKVKEDEKKLLSSLNGKYLQKQFINNYEEKEYYFLNEEENGENKELTLNKDNPLVSVVPGSYSDVEEAKKVAVTLDRLGISYDMNIISPIRYPEKFHQYIESMKDVKLFIAVSGLSAHVAGSIVAL